MEQILHDIQAALGVPAYFINQCNFLPGYIKEALISSINFIPWLYILYYGIELLERFFLTHIQLFIKLIKRLGPIFGTVISVVPECGYQVMASTFYSRRMFSRGTLLAFFISCSDDALPLLFMDFSKAFVIIPIVVIKIIVGIIVAYAVDIMFFFKRRITEDINAINVDLNDPACCHHRLCTMEVVPYWWMHPLTHTFNMFMFTFLSLAFLNCVILGFGGVENLASYIMIDSPIQVIVVAALGIIPNCVTSVFIALAYVKGIISFPSLIAGLTTVTGLGLAALLKRSKDNVDNVLIMIILLITGILTGLFVYYNMQLVEMIQAFFK